jgi:hypothetical protein
MVTLVGSSGCAYVFRQLELLSGVHTLLNVPIGVQERVFAVWLLRKGFTASARPTAAAPTQLAGRSVTRPTMAGSDRFPDRSEPTGNAGRPRVGFDYPLVKLLGIVGACRATIAGTEVRNYSSTRMTRAPSSESA